MKVKISRLGPNLSAVSLCAEATASSQGLAMRTSLSVNKEILPFPSWGGYSTEAQFSQLDVYELQFQRRHN